MEFAGRILNVVDLHTSRTFAVGRLTDRASAAATAQDAHKPTFPLN
jgi:hypothetical protein